MGHRANYAIRDQGVVRVFYSHWGALTVPQDLFWGPQYARAFIEQTEETGDWLDDVWAEGGAALDMDTRTLAFYGGDDLDESDLRVVIVKLMNHLWRPHGWTVQWVEGLPEVAAQVGVDPNSVCSAPSPPHAISPDDFGDNFEENIYGGLLSVKATDGWNDRVSDFYLIGILMNGPPLLDSLDRLPALEEARTRHAERPLEADEDAKGVLGDHLDDCAVIDAEAKTIHFSVAARDQEDLPEDLPYLREQWPGWVVEPHIEGLAGHFNLTGRELPSDLIPILPPDPEDETRSFEECLKIIEQALTKHTSGLVGRDPVSMFQRILDSFVSRDEGPVKVAPGALDPLPPVGVDEETARQLLADALAAVRAEATEP